LLDQITFGGNLAVDHQRLLAAIVDVDLDALADFTD
jgi:hypothetical protein